MKLKNRFGHMKLQLTLDVLDSDKAIQLAEATQEYVDIIEIGTLILLESFVGKSIRKYEVVESISAHRHTNLE